jgi:hypothetical protein
MSWFGCMLPACERRDQANSADAVADEHGSRKLNR